MDKLKNTEEYEYKIDDKHVIIVSPVYNEEKGKTVHEIMLNLIIRDCENPHN